MFTSQPRRTSMRWTIPDAFRCFYGGFAGIIRSLRFFDAENFMLSMIKPNAMLKDLIWTGRCPE